jgi:hypothetical protein
MSGERHDFDGDIEQLRQLGAPTGAAVALAFFCPIGWIWIYKRLAKTRGRSLERIEPMWLRDDTVARVVTP